MRPHRPGLIDALRWRWAFRAQRMADAKSAGIGLLLLACFGIVGEMDYRDQLAAEAEAQAARAEQAERTITECMNGRARWEHDDPEPRKGAFGKVVISCQKAEEFKV